MGLRLWRGSGHEWVRVSDGIYRKVLGASEDGMIVLYLLEAGSEVPMHSHEESQFGVVIKGRGVFITPRGTVEIGPGDSYSIYPDERHGFRVSEETIVVDFFTPSRREYENELMAPDVEV